MQLRRVIVKAVELEMTIGTDGSMRLPDAYHQIYGQHARIVILLSEPQAMEDALINPMKYANTVDWPVDGLTYQENVRDEWS